MGISGREQEPLAGVARAGDLAAGLSAAPADAALEDVVPPPALDYFSRDPSLSSTHTPAIVTGGRDSEGLPAGI